MQRVQIKLVNICVVLLVLILLVIKVIQHVFILLFKYHLIVALDFMLTNATHFPTDLVSKYQSTWTIMYPTGMTISRPNINIYVRFKIVSAQQDFATYNVVK
jgi:hypothetical protein